MTARPPSRARTAVSDNPVLASSSVAGSSGLCLGSTKVSSLMGSTVVIVVEVAIVVVVAVVVVVVVVGSSVKEY